MEENEYRSESIDHLGLVSGMYDELGIGEVVDSLISQDLEQRKLSLGQCLKAMVLAGLGFMNGRLYLIEQFFENKPVERLMGRGVEASHLNDDALGNALDAFHAYGVTELYSKIALKAARRLGLKAKTGHLDSTSLHVDGNYNHEDVGLDEVKVIRITQGYSRDHRAELNQAILDLIVEHQAGIPMMMQAASGNSSDKEGFRDIVDTHIGQLQQDYGLSTLVVDSAGFTAKSLEAHQAKGSYWSTAVPANVALAKDLLVHVDTTEMLPLSSGYQYLPLCTTYADVQQRWLLIYSSEAQKRAKKTVVRQQSKASDKALKTWRKLCHQEFACQQDAQLALEQFQREHPCLMILSQELIEHKHYDNPGRPKSNQQARISYSLDACFAMSLVQHQKTITRKSCFILASNQLDTRELSDLEILEGYKGQKYVERGFRFIKDPIFLISTIFLKKAERVMALLMLMTVCLLVYAALEYRIQAVLKANRVSVPDQKRKPTSKPTARWVFQLFIDVHLLTITSNNSVQHVILNLKPQLQRLLSLLGPPYIELYS